MQTVDHFLLRKGAANNVMVFTENDYDTNSSFTLTGDSYTFTHRAYGADMFRYSWNFGQNWTDWANWEDVTTINKSVFQDTDLFWEGNHIQVQCK
jgi:alpha-1,3-glucan synthase